MSTTTAARPVLTSDTTVAEALGLVSKGAIPMEAYLEWDSAQKAALEARAKASGGNGGTLRCKVSAKGALSIYGLSAKWPVTLYATQWERLFGFREQIEAFIASKPTAVHEGKTVVLAMSKAPVSA